MVKGEAGESDGGRNQLSSKQPSSKQGRARALEFNKRKQIVSSGTPALAR